MKSKFKARHHIVNFVKPIETQYNSTIKIIRSENGPEFPGLIFHTSKGIFHQINWVESPKKNDRIERKH